MEVLSESTKKTKELAERVAKKINLGDVIALYGDLGSGKTTFTSFLVDALGVKSRVQSPTFVIVRKYENINHIDLYRVSNIEELNDLGLNEMFVDPDSICIIEWPEVAEDLLPKDTKRIKFEYVDEFTRKITTDV